MSIYDEIAAERKKQDEKWGGPNHDDTHDSYDWIAYVTKHMGKAVLWPFDQSIYRKQMVCVAALAVAAIESIDRKTK